MAVPILVMLVNMVKPTIMTRHVTTVRMDT